MGNIVSFFTMAKASCAHPGGAGIVLASHTRARRPRPQGPAVPLFEGSTLTTQKAIKKGQATYQQALV
jgi:hypothetical protein